MKLTQGIILKMITSMAEMEAKLSIVQRWFGHVQCVGTIDALFSSDI